MTEQRTPQDRKQHLYLVFDDWSSGYSIRKVSLSRRAGKRCERCSEPSSDSSSSSSEEHSEQPAASSSGAGKGAKPPPVPRVFMRVSAPRGFPELFTSAFGPKIMVVHPGANGDDDDDPFAPFPTVDVEDRTVTFECQPNVPVAPIYVPVGDDRLFALDIGTFEILRKQERGERPQWVWESLASHPFSIWDVSSYCVQPDGCILFGTKSCVTFAFDTEEYVWRIHGDWVFPFAGRGHYDPSLEGFVGLSKDPETLGHLYCCTMPASTATGLDIDTTSLNFKCTKEKVYNKNPAAEGQHVSATLVHMRPGKFCLVECVSVGNRMTDRELEQELMRWVPPGADPLCYMGGGPQGGSCMYRLQTFSLSYGTEGDLKVEDSKVHCYSVPYEARIGTIYKDPVAFWL